MSQDLRNMVLGFRVSELKEFLGSAGLKKSGLKADLQERALELLKTRSPSVRQEVRELHNELQESRGRRSTATSYQTSCEPVYFNTSGEMNELRDMVLDFRVSELQELLGSAGLKKSGLKADLQERALELLKTRSSSVRQEIRELHSELQNSRGNRDTCYKTFYETVYQQSPFRTTTQSYYTSTDMNELRTMILDFRVSELQSLMRSTGLKISGLKAELQERALGLLGTCSSSVHEKVRELHRELQKSRGKRETCNQTSYEPVYHQGLPWATFQSLHTSARTSALKNTSSVFQEIGEPDSEPENGINGATCNQTSNEQVYQQDLSQAIVLSFNTSAEANELRNMILNFRVAELEELLGFAGVCNLGFQTDLQKRALELLHLRSSSIHQKIRELYNGLQGSTALNNAPVVNQTSCQLTRQQELPTTSFQPFTRLAQTKELSNKAHPQQYTSGKPSQPTFTIHPDMRFKKLPFFDVLADLIKPSSLTPNNSQQVQEQIFYFSLTTSQCTAITSNSVLLDTTSKFKYLKQVQLRFCLLNPSCEQEDFFPPSIILKVNDKPCPLPNPLPINKPGVPINITPMIILLPDIQNTITVSWVAEHVQGYVMSVTLVHVLNPLQLLQKLHKRSINSSDYTRDLIKKEISGNNEIQTTSISVSLMCPLSKMRMKTPSRATTCQHIQCFDALIFLQMNERKATWRCPVCHKPVLYDHLVIDGYFQSVLASSDLPADTNVIQVHSNGFWSPHVEKKDEIKTIKLDEYPEDTKKVKDALVKTEIENSVYVDLTLSDSEDDEPIKSRTPPKPDSTNILNNSDKQDMMWKEMKKMREEIERMKKKEKMWEKEKQEYIEVLKESAELHGREKKKMNIIIKGLEVNKGLEVDVKEFLKTKLGLEVNIKKAYILSIEKKEILVEFVSLEKKMEVMSYANKLKDMQVYIDHDLAPGEKKIQSSIEATAKEERDKGITVEASA